MGWFRRRSRGAVVGKEQLLERWLAAEQLVHPGGGEHRQQRFDDPSTWQRTRLPSTSTADTPGTRVRSGGEPSNSASIDRADEVAHLGQRADLDELTGAQDADAIAQCLDLAQDVRRQEHRLAAPRASATHCAKRLLHQRVETSRRLVEQEQVRLGT